MNKILLVLLLLSQGLFAQSLPPDPKAGHCYVKCIDSDNRIYWREVDCNDVKKQTETLSIDINNFENLKAHQQNLKNLGYDVEISGVLDYKTEIAHNKYINTIKKEEKRNKRKEARKKRRLEKNK